MATPLPPCELATARHLAARLTQFYRPAGLLAWWYQPLTQQRLAMLRPAWRREIRRRLDITVAAMNMAGPY